MTYKFLKNSNRAELLSHKAMRGILDLDVLCLKEIFKSLEPLGLCSLRQSCTQLRDDVDDHFHSLYFVREQWLDLRGENIRNVNRILKNFGRLVRRLRVSEEVRGQNLLLDVALTNCGAMLKGLSLESVQIYEIDMEKFVGVFDNLEILQLVNCNGDQKCIEQLLLGHEYPNLTTLRTNSCIPEIFQKFFMRKRSIKILSCGLISSDTSPLIALNCSEIEELDIFPENDRNLISLAQLRKLKRLAIGCHGCDEESITALIKELSVNNKLDRLSMFGVEFTDVFCNALSNLTNLKELRIWQGSCTLNDTKSLEKLGRKLSKLESLMVVKCDDFPCRNFLPSDCKSDNFRKFYFWAPDMRESNCFFEQTVKDFIERIGHRSFVSGDHLCIYLYEGTFNDLKESLTQENLQSIEKFGNIKVLPCNSDDLHKF